MKHVLTSTDPYQPKNFRDVDVVTWLKYMEQAEDLILRGYVPHTVQKRTLAEKLWKASINNSTGSKK